MDKIKEIFNETFEDTTSSTNITFQPKFIREILPKLYKLLVDELVKAIDPNNLLSVDTRLAIRTDCITALKRVLLGEEK